MNREEYLKTRTKPDPIKHCAYCGKEMHRIRFNSGRLEDLSAFLRRVYCNRECMRKAFVKVGESNQLYSDAHHSAREIAYLVLGREYKCERCGSTRNVDVHHKDRNHLNNTPENLELLCRSCHMKEHRKVAKLCSICGQPTESLGYCNKHYIRYKKYGNPLMCYHKIVEE